MTKVRFQADADLNQAIVSGTIRREPQINFKSANSANFAGKSDSEVLKISAKDKRILVTHDRKTMPTELANFTTTKTCSGVLIVSQDLPIGEAIESLILIWEASTEEEWINQIMSIPF